MLFRSYFIEEVYYSFCYIICTESLCHQLKFKTKLGTNGTTGSMNYQINQVASLIRSLQRKGNVFRPLTEFECLMQVTQTKELLSRLYALLLQNNSTTNSAKQRWEKDLCIPLTEDQWISLIRNNIFFSCNVAIQENRFKL